MLFTFTNQSSRTIGGSKRPLKIQLSKCYGEEFDMKKVSFTFDGREASLEQPFIYDVAEVEA